MKTKYEWKRLDLDLELEGYAALYVFRLSSAGFWTIGRYTDEDNYWWRSVGLFTDNNDSIDNLERAFEEAEKHIDYTQAMVTMIEQLAKCKVM